MVPFETLKVTEEFEREASSEFTKEQQEEMARRILEKQYAERENLGKGKAAEVWFGDDPAFSKKLCAKTNYNPDATVNSLSREFDLQQEFHRAGIQVPKVWMLIEEKDDSSPVRRGVIVMETIKGSNLKELLEKMEVEDQKFTVDQYKKISADLENQIKKAHAAGLYHRDLHFGNIMIDKELNVYLIDFGDATTAFASAEDAEIYNTDSYKNGKPVRIKFPKDENILGEFAREVVKRKLIKKVA